jgi:hypothetical protein
MIVKEKDTYQFQRDWWPTGQVAKLNFGCRVPQPLCLSRVRILNLSFRHHAAPLGMTVFVGPDMRTGARES